MIRLGLAMSWRAILAAVALVAVLAVAALVIHSRTRDDCIILTLTGNRLCGDDARAWCESTDRLRQLGADPRPDDPCEGLR